MNVHASPLVPLEATEASLTTVLSALDTHDDKALHIDYAGRRAQPGYHVTEVKAGSFVTLDCGANADAWQETILQVEDIPAKPGDRSMTVGKFRNILAQVDRKVRLNGDARLTFEIGPPDAPMQIFDVARLTIEGDAAVLLLGPRPAICKPRHRATQAAEAAACCSPSTGSSSAASCC
jgi:hypothetical protein